MMAGGVLGLRGAVCLVSGEPSGLTATLPKALAELKNAVGRGATIKLGFDRGGACPQVFTRQKPPAHAAQPCSPQRALS